MGSEVQIEERSKFEQKKIIVFWGLYVVHSKRRDSPYVVHFKCRDSPYVVHFKHRVCPYVKSLPSFIPPAKHNILSISTAHDNSKQVVDEVGKYI